MHVSWYSWLRLFLFACQDQTRRELTAGMMVAADQSYIRAVLAAYRTAGAVANRRLSTDTIKRVSQPHCMWSDAG
jgi:hypothetical protein